MKALTLNDLRQATNSNEIINTLVTEGKMSRNEADYYLALLSDVPPGDVATATDLEIEEFMKLREHVAEAEPRVRVRVAKRAAAKPVERAKPPISNIKL